VIRRAVDGALDDGLARMIASRPSGAGSLTLLRHGQTDSSDTLPDGGFFAGQIDVPLTEAGEADAAAAGEVMAALGVPVGLTYTSILQRADRTLTRALAPGGYSVPTTRDSRLNERDYGALAGQPRGPFMDDLTRRIAALWQAEPALRAADARTIAQALAARWNAPATEVATVSVGPVDPWIGGMSEPRTSLRHPEARIIGAGEHVDVPLPSASIDETVASQAETAGAP
jgi:broad specificity phosphatase PhoE